MQPQSETWQPIPGYEFHYVVSDHGRIRGLTPWSRGDKIAHVIRNGSGYLYVSLSNASKSRRFPVHTLVMLAFRGPRPDGHQIHHLNGDRSDNRLSNLTYLPSDVHNTMSKNVGSENGQSKLDKDSVRHFALANEGVPERERCASMLAQ